MCSQYPTPPPPSWRFSSSSVFKRKRWLSTKWATSIRMQRAPVAMTSVQVLASRKNEECVHSLDADLPQLVQWRWRLWSLWVSWQEPRPDLPERRQITFCHLCVERRSLHTFLYTRIDIKSDSLALWDSWSDQLCETVSTSMWGQVYWAK